LPPRHGESRGGALGVTNKLILVGTMLPTAHFQGEFGAVGGVNVNGAREGVGMIRHGLQEANQDVFERLLLLVNCRPCRNAVKSYDE